MRKNPCGATAPGEDPSLCQGMPFPGGCLHSQGILREGFWFG